MGARMTSTVAILDVSPVFDSTRRSALQLLQGSPAPQPLAARRFGDQPLLTWIVRRISHAQQISRVVVLGDSSLNQHRTMVENAGVQMIASAAVDPLSRLAAAVQQISQQHLAAGTAPPQGYIRVSIDSPFVDPALLDGLAIQGAAHSDVDYISYRTMARNTSLARLGLAGEWFRSSAVMQADREASSGQREEPLQYIYSRADLFQLRLLAAPQALDQGDLRLAVKTPEDWDHMQAIREALEAGASSPAVDRENVGWRQINALLNQQCGIRKRMAELNAASSANSV